MHTVLTVVRSRGEAIDIECEGHVIARGLTQYAQNELSMIAGQDSQQFEELLGEKLVADEEKFKFQKQNFRCCNRRV